MQPPPRRVPVEAGAPPSCQRTASENGRHDESIPRMDSADIDTIVRAALAEDLPDITSESIFENGERGRARFLMKATGVLAGLPFAEATFKAIDPSSSFAAKASDGDRVQAGDIVAEVEASVIALLSGERTALNF